MKKKQEHGQKAASSVSASRAEPTRWTYDRGHTEPELDVPELEMIGCDHFRRATRLPEHRHPDGFEFVYAEKGKASWELGGARYETKAGELFHTRPGEWHSGGFNVIEPSKIWWVIIRPPDEPGWLSLSSPEREEIRSGLLRLPRVVALGPKALQPFQRLKRAISRTERGLQAVEARVALLDLLLLLLEPDGRTALEDDALERLRGIAQRIDERPEWRPSVDELAGMAQMSPSHFYRMFQQYAGLSPMSYIERKRIEAAGRTLAAADEPVTRTALELGYQSSQHFATVFKRFTGMTPTEWRKWQKGADADAPARTQNDDHAAE